MSHSYTDTDGTIKKVTKMKANVVFISNRKEQHECYDWIKYNEQNIIHLLDQFNSVFVIINLNSVESINFTYEKKDTGESKK